MTDRELLSIVVPVFNEQDSLAALHDRIAKVIPEVGLDWELIFVDDGSTDESPEVMRGLHERDRRVKALFLSRNFGHEVASTAGLDVARGAAAVLMDGDLQDPPETIPALVEKWREGYDLVCAQRVRREGESVFKRGTAYLFYRLMGRLVGWDLPRDTGDFRLMDRRVLAAFTRCRENNRFVRALIGWTGFRQTTIPFERPPRSAGETKYRPWSLVGLAITSITSFSVAPLRIALWTGLLVVLLSLVFIAVTVVRRLCGDITNPSYGFLIASIWFLGGVNCLLLGIVGEYLGRTYVESRNRPLYFVRDALGIDDRDLPAVEHGTQSRETGR